MSVLTELLPGLALTLATALIVTFIVYFPHYRSRPEYMFTYLVFSGMAYIITSLLRDVQLTLGFSFGMLAVFTLLRYRTDAIPIREMTFLYISITVPFVNALFLATRISFNELILLNGGIVLFLFVFDRGLQSYYGLSETVNYEKIDLVRTENYEELLEDLRQRMGVRVKRCVVEEVDFLTDTAILTVYFDPPVFRGKSR